MPRQQWGRKETVIWPPQVPIWTYTALLLALPLGLWFFATLYSSKPLLERSSTLVYLKSTLGSYYNGHGKYRLVYLEGGKHAPRPAQSADIEPESSDKPDGKRLGMVLTAYPLAQGYTMFGRGPEMKYEDVRLHNWMQTAIFGGQSLLGSYWIAFAEWGTTVLFFLGFAAYSDFRRSAVLKYGRLLRGPVMLEPKAFNRRLKSKGIGVQTTKQGAMLRLPTHAEAKHLQIMGDTGTGKSQLLMQLLDQIEGRGESAIVYDSAGELAQKYFDEDRGDVILNPLDARCPYWDPSSEMEDPAEADTIAVSFYQPADNKLQDFFVKTPQKVFAHLLKYKPTPQQLVAWMSNEDEIDKRVAKTPLAQMIGKDAPDQRRGVLGSLAMIADTLSLLPAKAKTATTTAAAGAEANKAKAETAEKPQVTWSARKWAKERRGWIFFTATEATAEALRPLQSLWIDLLVLRLLTLPEEGQKRVWFVLDELASLQRLPQFHTALTKGRKSDNPIIFGYQGRSQIEALYGHLAETLLSQPSTKIILKTAEPNAAKWASELIGEIEIERVKETVAHGKRAGKSYTLDRQIEPLVMRSEIQGLEDLHAFLKLGNYVTRFSFPHKQRKEIAKAMIKRREGVEQMWLVLDEPEAEQEAKTEPTPGNKAEAEQENKVEAESKAIVQVESPTPPVIVPPSPERTNPPLSRAQAYDQRPYDQRSSTRQQNRY